MAKKNLYLIIDTETSERRHVIDFAAVICDRYGHILHKCAVLISDFYEKEKLFYNRDSGFFGIKNLEKRNNAYISMLNSGQRVLASVASVNRWLSQAARLNPILTAYNLPFDKNCCDISGIMLPFTREFCLWQASCGIYAKRKGYINFCLQNRGFSAKCIMLTNAEIMAQYITGNNNPEPHTALEDVIDYELPILTNILKQKKKLSAVKYNWRNYQLADLAVAK